MANLTGKTTDANTAGVLGESEKYIGVKGISAAEYAGVAGISPIGPGVTGESVSSVGVHGKSTEGIGVHGESVRSTGVHGNSYHWFGMHGQSTKSTGVVGYSQAWIGVYGESKDEPPIEFTGTAGDLGAFPNSYVGEHKLKPKPQKGIGIGVAGKSKTGRGILGESETNTGVEGRSGSGVGVWAVSEKYEGLHAETRSQKVAAIAAYNLNPIGSGAALFAKKEGSEGHAGFFVGNVHVTGNITAERDICCLGADFAEDFNIAEEGNAEPGTVMILGEEDFLEVSTTAYDKRVAGILSGAGTYRPGIILDKQTSGKVRKPVALVGKVFCKVDAQYGAIETGDLLTTSFTPGHAMKASDPLKAFGAVIGKALKPFTTGQGFIPVLVSLR